MTARILHTSAFSHVHAPRIVNTDLLLAALERFRRRDYSDPCKSRGHLVAVQQLEDPHRQTTVCMRCLCAIDLTRKEQ